MEKKKKIVIGIIVGIVLLMIAVGVYYACFKTPASESENKEEDISNAIGLKKYGIKDSIVTVGNGIYEVTHDGAVIEALLSDDAKENLKLTEYRYAGNNPDNYVTFNNELWRIIGLVNTAEGQRMKLVRHESIGAYSWDSSMKSVNNGSGVNEWSEADIMKLLNPGYESESIGGSLYYNSQNGNCYSGMSNANSACDFSSTGLSDTAKNMIEITTWNVGSNGINSYTVNTDGLTKHFYNYERSNNNGKVCTSESYCNDSVIRTTVWRGEVGLISASDYGYATSGGNSANRETCLNKELYNWKSSVWSESLANDCKNNDWLYKTKSNQWTITPSGNSTTAHNIISIYSDVNVAYTPADEQSDTRPSVYLNSDIKVVSGKGTLGNPFRLS